MRRTPMAVPKALLLFLALAAMPAAAQTASREYIRLNGNVVAIETTPQAETVSTPSTPSGPASGSIGTSYSYSTGGSVDNLGYQVQYEFDWGDGTNSGWLATGTISASHSWAAAGTYSVTAEARSATNNTVVSSVSIAFSMVIQQPEAVTAPSTPTGTASGYAGTSYSYSTGSSVDNLGNPVQYEFSWGNMTNSGWLATGTTSATQTWSTPGTYSVTAEARSATNSAVVSGSSTALNVTVGDPVPTLLSFGPSGSGSAGMFTAQVMDYAGAADLNEVQYWFNSSNGNCHLAYFPGVNQIYLDSSSANYNWVGSGTPGSGVWLSNGFCSVYLGYTSVSSSGTTLTMSAYISFAVANSTCYEYLAATNGTGTAGWTYFGAWTVPAPPPTASLTANGQSSITVSPGTNITYQWSSSNADTYWSTVTSISPGGSDACGNAQGGSWAANSASGSLSAAAASCQAGYTYTIVYYAEESSTGQEASSAITIAVN